MKFIELTTDKGNKVLINLNNVTHFFSHRDGDKTTICFTTHDDYVVVDMTVDQLRDKLLTTSDCDILTIN